MDVRGVLPTLSRRTDTARRSRRADPARHIECRECGANLALDAGECPHCGGGVAVYELA